MENLNEEFYNRFIHILKKTISEKGNLARRLSEILNVEKMSIYRRLRGEVPFTFAEIIAISRQLNISLDYVSGITSTYKSIPFQLHFQDYFSLNEIDFKMDEDYISVIKAASNNSYSEFGFASSIFPMHALINFPILYRFFLMKWMYQFGETAPLLYSEIYIPERLSMLHKEYLKAVQDIKYTFFIFHNFALAELIHDIQYFKSIFLLTDADVDLLKNCLYDALNMVDNFAINGTFPTGNKIDIYHRSIPLDANLVRLLSSGRYPTLFPDSMIEFRLP